MAHQEMIFRQAAPDESDQVATIARESRTQCLPFLPTLHSLDGDKSFYRKRVFPDCEVWVAEDKGELVGFCAFKEDWVEHLYLLPTHLGQGIGETLLKKAQENHGFLQLWVFQRNSRAISFYQRNGFTKVRETDGASNEEKCPDALLEWRRQPD